MTVARLLVLLFCAQLASSFLIQRAPLQPPRAADRARRVVAAEGDVKITVKPPSGSTSAAESDGASASSNVKIRIKPKGTAAAATPEVPVAVDDDEMKMTVKMPDSVPVVVEQRENLATPVRSDAEKLLLNATQAANCTRLLQALEMGANPNMRDPKGRTPLHFVAGIGLAPACLLLVHYGAQIDVQDEGGLTPMHMAAGYANAQTLKVLVMAGADPSIAGESQGTPLEIVTALGEVQYQDFMKRRQEDKNPLNKLKKKDDKLEELKKCMEVLETQEEIMKVRSGPFAPAPTPTPTRPAQPRPHTRALPMRPVQDMVWEDELREVLKTMKIGTF